MRWRKEGEAGTTGGDRNHVASKFSRKHQSFGSMEGIAGQDTGKQLSLVQIRLFKGP